MRRIERPAYLLLAAGTAFALLTAAKIVWMLP